MRQQMRISTPCSLQLESPAGEEEKKAEVVSAMSQTSTAAGSSTSRFLHLSRVKQKTTTEEEKTHMGKCLNIHTRHGLGCFGAMAFWGWGASRNRGGRRLGVLHPYL